MKVMAFASVRRRHGGFSSHSKQQSSGTRAGTFRAHTNLAVSSVCSLWRSLALHTPELWNSLCPMDRSPAFEWTTLCLTRSGSHPLHLEFRWTNDDVPREYSKFSNSDVRNLFTILYPSVARWRYLFREVDDNAIAETVFSYLAGSSSDVTGTNEPQNFPLTLETIAVRANGSNWKRLPAFKSPALAKLSVYGCSMNWDNSPFLGLRSLLFSDRGRIHDLPEILSMLGQCPQLEEFDIPAPRLDSRHNLDSFTPITLQALERVRLRQIRVKSTIHQLMGLIDCPKLNFFAISDGQCGSELAL